MTALIATIRKELQLLRRDIHGLLLLFVMPVAFILIMSLALQEQFARHGSAHPVAALLDNRAGTTDADRVTELLAARGTASWQTAGADAAMRVQQDDVAFLLTLREADGQLVADILVSPATTAPVEAVFTAMVSEAMSRQRIEALLREIKMQRALRGEFSGGDSLEGTALDSNPVSVHYSFHHADNEDGVQPNSVQQSVPAWLVFAMFFSVVPLSNTLVTERQQGTLRRLRTLPVSPMLPIFGKLVPYFFINLLQAVLMLCVGVFVMPLFGAERLTLGHSPAGLAIMSACISVAALGYGILIASIARTTEQATTLGGVGNILLAAIGGIMVPRFVMPTTMQQLADCSPMAWGLDGLLDLLLRGGDVTAILPEAGSLLLFGSVTIALAMALSLRRHP